MAYSGRVPDYLGEGLHADRPVSLNLAPGCIGIWRSTDTGDCYVWSDSAWHSFSGGGGTSLGWFDVSDYGAVGDVIELTDAVVTSADATVTSASAAFTSGDIGKKVLLVKSDNTAKQITTIASINSGTSIELAATATFSGTGCRLLYGTDDTSAIQDAIDAAEAAGGGVVYFPGQHCISGALQDTSRSNSQLVLPIIDVVDGRQMTIEFVGKFAPPCDFSVIGATPVPVDHSILYGFLDTGSGGALLGGWGPVGTAGTLTNVHVIARNFAVRMPPNPVLTALDFSSAVCVDVDNVVIDCGSYYIQGFAEPTTTNSYGIKMPKTDNGALSRIGTVNVAGLYNGYQFSEHCNGFACQAAWGCKQAFVFASGAYHASYFDRLMAVHCEKVIVGTGTHYLNIAQLNIEHATSGWWVTDYDIDDASHYLQGNLNWHVVLAGSGVDSTFTVNGGAKLNITRNGYQNRVEQVSVSAAITFEGKHANKHIYHPSADTTARTWTIPANSSVPYPIGTTLTFVNDNGAGALTIAINTDTLRLAGAGTTGSRTLAANGVATAVKITSTSWQINGSGLT